jgi:PAS domain S-box-containing protein
MAAWYGGLWPGVLAVVLSAVGANWFFIAPAGVLSFHTYSDLATMGAFVLACSFIVGAMEAMHRARTHAVADVRKRETAELETLRQKELLATTLASIGDAVIATDTEGRVVFLNAHAEELTGWKSAEAAKRPLSEVFRIVDEKTRQPVENPVEKVLRLGTVTGLANHTLLIAKDGRVIPVGDSAAPIRQPDGPLYGVILVFRDVTLQRNAQKASERLAAIVEHSGDVMLTKNLNGMIQTWNASAERLFGYRAEEIIGRHVTVLFPPDRLTEEDYIMGRLREGRHVERLETIRVTKSGQRIPVSVSVSPLKDSDGKIVGASKIVHDITERRRAEESLREAHEQLADHAGQLETLVQERTARLQDVVDELQHVSYAMAHDMRAPLRAMNTFANLLAEKASSDRIDPADAKEYTRRIIVAAKRLDKLIQDALNYTKVAQQEIPLGQVDLSKLVRDLIDTYPNFHADKADILIVNKLPVVSGNDSLLTQCFSNLLGNAVKFVAPGVKPKVRVRAETGNGTARIWIEDNGIGIPKNAQPRLFQMFQKLDAEYEGTGIGLAIVRKVIERMGGKVGVESERGKGSSFWVDIPLARGQNKERMTNK